MRGKTGRILRLVIPIACLIWLGWIVASLGPRRVARVAAEADPVWLALSFVPILARFLIWGVKWNGMLRRHAPVGFPLALRALLAGVFVNLTTPTAKLAGGFVRAALIHRRAGWRMSVAYGWSFADQATNLLGNLTLYGIVAVGAGVTLAPGAARVPLLISGAAGLATVAILVSLRRPGWRAVQRPGLARWLARITPQRFRTIENGEPAAAWVRPVFEPLLNHGRTSRVAPQDLGLAACSFASLCLANAMVLHSLGVESPLLLISAVVVVGYLAGTLVGTVGGIGVTEIALIKLWTAAGVSLEAATAGSLLHRASYYLVIAVFGGTSLLLEGRQKA